MVARRTDREQVMRRAVDAFGGTLHQFYFSFGDYDGVAITTFKHHETALACLMTIFAQGSLTSLKTTPLFEREE